ncbi:MAG: DUF4396 domain-containing protein [Flavobacteriales bacterium]|nr:DUF4396 domain-containing protein [Flavobacteriales bacterium]
METIKLDTTLHCDSCVSKIKPLFDTDDRVKSWSVDLEVENHPISVEGELSAAEVKILMQKAGFDTLEKENFWGDKAKWKRAMLNTINCLIGCSIGDFGTIIFFQQFFPETNVFLSMSIAMLNGLITSVAFEAILLKLREGFGLLNAVKVAFGMSFLSMLAMELAENATDYFITKGNLGVNEPLFWVALGCALVAGFLVPLPYNYYKLKKFNKACH